MSGALLLAWLSWIGQPEGVELFSEMFGRVMSNHVDAMAGVRLFSDRLAVYLPGIEKFGLVRYLPAALVIAFWLRMSERFW